MQFLIYFYLHSSKARSKLDFVYNYFCKWTGRGRGRCIVTRKMKVCTLSTSKSRRILVFQSWNVNWDFFFLFKDIIFSQQPGMLLEPLVRPRNVPAVGKQRSIHPWTNNYESFSYVRHFIKKYSSLHLRVGIWKWPVVMWSSDVELFDHFSVYLASHAPLQQFIEKIIEFVKEINDRSGPIWNLPKGWDGKN